MKRTNSQKGRYSKNKGAKEELRIAKILTKWAKKSYGNTSTFMRTYSSGSMSARTEASNIDYLLGDVYPTGKVAKVWHADIEAKCYNSTSLRRYYEGTKRLQSWLFECYRDTMKHDPKENAIPILITHINRFRDMVMLPYEADFFKQMSSELRPCWVSFQSFKVPRNKHVYRFLMILTDLQSIIKSMTCKQFIECYKHCDWNKMNKKYLKYNTASYLQSHSRAEMSRVNSKVTDTLKSHK